MSMTLRSQNRKVNPLERATDLGALWLSEINSFGHQVPTRELARSLASNDRIPRVYVDEALNIANRRLILDAILGNCNIKTLNFTVNPVVAGLVMKRMKHIENVKFYVVSMVGGVGETRSLQLNRNLQKLRVTGGNLGDILADAVAQVVQFPACSLTNIIFSVCSLSNNGFASIGQALQSPSMLTYVDVRDSDLVLEDGAATEFAQGIEENTSVKTLMFQANRVHLVGWERIIRALTMNVKLEEVGLFLGTLDREGWFFVARMLAESADTAQRTFYLSVGVDRAWKTGMRTFCLYQGDTEDIRNVCDALRRHDALDKLVLCHCQVTMEEIRLIGDMVTSSSMLKILKMESYQFDDNMSVALFEALKQNHSVESVDLSGNHINAAAAADFVASSQTVKNLNLDYNNLGDAGFGALGKALESNMSLEVLKMKYHDNVTASGTRALLDGIRVHQGLKRVEVTLESTSQKDELAFYLERNKHAKPILHSIPLSIWPLALKRAGNCRRRSDFERVPDMLYYFVKEKCELFARGPSSRKRKRGSA